jgi:hypothetical protein
MHEDAKIGFRGLHEEVIVVGHQNECVQGDAVFVKGIRKIGEKLHIKRRGQKNLSPLISSGGDMIESTLIEDTKGACHKGFHNKLTTMLNLPGNPSPVEG